MLGTAKGVYKFTFDVAGEEYVYVGQAKGVKGFAQRVKVSLRENLNGKAPTGAKLKKVEFFKAAENTKKAINELEAEILEKAGGVESNKVINVRNAPTTE